MYPVYFVQRGNGEDLDEVIVLHREVLNLRSVGHPDRAASLNNLVDLDEANTLVRVGRSVTRIDSSR
jgi:hypothetical protein